MADTPNTFTSGLGKVLDQLSRGSYGGVNTILNALRASKGTETLDPLGAFKRGAMLEEKPLGSEVIGEVFGQQGENAAMPEKITRATAGLLIDIFADPTTYLGVGALTKLGKAAEVGTSIKKALQAGEITKGLETGSKVERILAKVNNPINREFGETLAEQGARGQRGLLTFAGTSIMGSKADEAAFKLLQNAKMYMKHAPILRDIIAASEHIFKYKSGIPELDKAMEIMHGDVAIKGHELAERVKLLKDKMGKISKADNNAIIDYMKNGTKVAPHLQELGEDFKKFFNEIGEMEKAKGVLKTTIDNYIPGIATEEGLKLAQKVALKAGRKMSEITTALNANMPKIITRELTPSQANEVIRKVVGTDLPIDVIHKEIVDTLSKEAKAQLEGIRRQARMTGTKEVGDFFHEDLATLAHARSMKGVKAIAAADFFAKVKTLGLDEKAFNALGDEAKFGFREIKGIQGLDGKYFPAEVADSIQRYHTAMTNDKVMNEFLGMYKQTINWWKRWTLSIFPEYHVRNIVGNMFNNFIVAGIKSPMWYLKAGLIQKNPKAVNIINKATGEAMTGEQLIKEMQQFNVIGTGQTAIESAESYQKSLKGGTFDPLAENNHLIRAGRKAGEIVENNGRIAHYLFQRQKGLAPFEAAMSVKKALFDYSQLTSFEKNYLRFVFPFYAWSRNNIPLQVANLIQQPGKYTALGKAKQETEQVQGTRDANVKWLPEFMKESFPVLLDRMPEGERYKVLLMTSWLPAGDIDRLFDPAGLVSGSQEPFSKELLQQAMGKDFFLNKDIENYPGEITSFLGVDMPARWKHVLKMFRLLNWIDQMNPNNVFGNKDEGTRSVFGAKRRMIDLSPSERKWKAATGMKLYPYDVEQGRRFETARLDAQLKKQKVWLKKYKKEGDFENVAKILAKMDELKEKKKER